MQSVQPQVAEHYNQIRQKSREERQSSEILGVKRFNNWVKSVLIQRFTVPAATALDLCCGKGGDLLKFKKANVRQYVGADHALQSIKDAVQRYNEVNPLPFSATFICGDCHATPLAAALPPSLQFDIVSCQFALHYSFESEARARMFARNIAERLKPGGTFVATFPSADVLQKKLEATVQAQRDRSTQRMAQASAAGTKEEARPLRLEFGNSVYKVKFTSPCPLVFEQNAEAQAAAAAAAAAASAASSQLPLPPPVPPLPSSPFGVQYTFDLTDAIAECPEYMVPLPTLCALLAEHECELVLVSSMHQFFLDHAGHEEYGRLLKQMKVLGSDYERPPTRDEWEVLNVYCAVAFRKRLPGEAPGSHPDVALNAHAQAPATSCLHRRAPPATPWQNLTKQDEQLMQLHRLTHADIKIIKTPAAAAAAAAK